MTEFEMEVAGRIANNNNDAELKSGSKSFLLASIAAKYSYNFSWMGRPIIQYPQDMLAMQELIWQVRPDLIIETGIAHGGSLIFSASMLALLDMCEAIETGNAINPLESRRKVLGVDIDIRPHNRAAIESHPMGGRIQMIQGSSIAPEVIREVHSIAKDKSRVLVCLDSNHTHEHVLEELNAYAPLTSINSYCVVFDTAVDDLPSNLIKGRPWGKNNNPKTAVMDYLKMHTEFEIDKDIQNKIMITVAPDGYLRRVK